MKLKLTKLIAHTDFRNFLMVFCVDEREDIILMDVFIPSGLLHWVQIASDEHSCSLKVKDWLSNYALRINRRIQNLQSLYV